MITFPNAVENTLMFFGEAVPEPTNKNITTQMGVHFEEVAEMVEELTSDSPHGIFLINRALAALKDLSRHLKENDDTIRVNDASRVGMLDALCDQLVTAVGTGYMLGMDISGGFDEVNRSNLSKFDEDGKPIFDENGKVTKGPNYVKAKLDSFV